MTSIDANAIIALIPTLLGLWIIVSIPVYVAAKAMTSGRAKFTQAMGATILGSVAYFGVIMIISIMLGSIVGGWATIPAIILALGVWLGVYKASFHTGWLGAIGIAVLAILVFIAASFVVAFVMGMLMPGSPPTGLPAPLQQV